MHRLLFLLFVLPVCASASGCGSSDAATGDSRSGSDAVDVGPEASAADPMAPDSTRLLRDLGVLAHDSMRGRATGTPGNAAARGYLVDQLRRAGVEPVGSDFEHSFTWGEDRSGVNVLGSIPGSDPTATIVLSAHYDHVGVREDSIFNGADDNASGTAAVLEIGRLVRASPLRNSVVLAFFDAEETGLRGARAFVADAPVPLDGSVLNVNLDMVSRSGGVLWAAGAHHTPALRPILETVATTAPVDLRLGHDRPDAPEGDDWTGASDHGPFHDAGIPFVYFGVEDHPDYHRPTDDVERVDPGEFVNAVRAIVQSLLALDEALPLPDAESRE